MWREKCGLSNLIGSTRALRGLCSALTLTTSSSSVGVVAVQEEDPSFTCTPDGYLVEALPAWRRLKISRSVASRGGAWGVRNSFPLTFFFYPRPDLASLAVRMHKFDPDNFITSL